jgi:hypothetical protein
VYSTEPAPGPQGPNHRSKQPARGFLGFPFTQRAARSDSWQATGPTFHEMARRVFARSSREGKEVGRDVRGSLRWMRPGRRPPRLGGARGSLPQAAPLAGAGATGSGGRKEENIIMGARAAGGVAGGRGHVEGHWAGGSRNFSRRRIATMRAGGFVFLPVDRCAES